MATALDQSNSLPPQPAIGKGKVGDTDPPTKLGVKIQAAIFFDGTGNNENNIKKRLADPSYMRPLMDPLGFRESYKNGFTNVAILHFMHQKEVEGKHIVSVYIEGIGTVDDGDDPFNGRAFGSGPSGIADRVTEGITRLASKVNTLLATQEDGFLEELNIHAFGFSRGSAAARHFCARRTDSMYIRNKTTNNLCQELGAAVDQAVVKLKFVGLFDTVSSYNYNYYGDDDSRFGIARKIAENAMSDASFHNDVGELHLRLEDPTLEKVVQLRAADEFRINFALTTIESATSQGKGLELLLPGAHSDVGGSYLPHASEIRKYETASQYQLASHFRTLGYYAPGQLVTTWRNRAQHSAGILRMTGTRTPGNSYQHVSLAVMLKLIEVAECEVTFDSPTAPDERTVVYKVPAGRLSTLRDHLAGYAAEQFAARPAKAVTAPVSEADYHWLRQDYLHLSWSGDKGMEMRNRDFDDATRENIAQQEGTPQSSHEPAPAGSTAAPLPPADSTGVPLPPADSTGTAVPLPPADSTGTAVATLPADSTGTAVATLPADGAEVLVAAPPAEAPPTPNGYLPYRFIIDG